jgi:hypothetical protein
LNPANRSALNATIASVEEKISTLQARISALTSAQKAYELATSTLTKAETDLQNAQEEKRLAEAALASATSTTEELTKALATINERVEAAKGTLTSATSNEALAKAAVDSAGASVALQTTALATAQALLNSAANTAGLATANLLSAQSALETAETNLNSATQAASEAQSALNTAQDNYDNNLIPDPTWTAPTYQKEHTRQVENTRTVEVRTLVPHETTTLQEQVIPNLLFNSDFSRGTEGWSGVNPGWQGSNPSLVNGEVTFSYQNQTVSQGLFSGPFQNATLTLSADWLNNDLNRGITDNYSMTVEAKDINQNPVGIATYTSTGSHDWENKSVSLVATGPVSYITVSFSGIDNGFWYGTYGPHFKNPALQISHGQMITETTYEEVITYEQETYFTTETYYTTELVTVEGTINVKINEGGQATFNAPEGAVFTGSTLRYEAIDRPTCGKNIAPNVSGLSSITIQALNSVWGDPCGGWYKHVTGTLTYQGQPTAPLIKDPALLPALEAAITSNEIAQTNLQEAQSTLSLRQSAFSAASTDKDVADTDLATAQATLDLTQADLTAAQQEQTTAEQQLTSAKAEVAAAQTIVDTHVAEQTTTQTTFTEATQTLTEATTSHEEATNQVVAQEASVVSAKTTFTEATTDLATSYEEVRTAPKPDQEITKAEEIITEPVPEPEEGSKEIPAELSAENLMEVNLEAVDPTELTEAQAEQLKEAALETFLTAEEGSAEYEQALDALYLAAEQDDIVLDESLAAIPGLAGVVEVLNFLGNAGADMSPKVREESEKVVVTAVVAAGAAIQSAAAAASTASAPSGGSSRKIR